MISSYPEDFAPQLTHGKVLALGTNEPGLNLAQLEEWIDQECLDTRFVGIRLKKASTLNTLIESYIEGLATAALATWPDWYGADSDTGQFAKIVKGVSVNWRTKALNLASLDKLPLPDNFPSAFQAEQLSKALGDPELTIGIAIEKEGLTSTQLKSLVASSMWLAEQTKAKLALIIPADTLFSSELDRIAKESLAAIEVVSIIKKTAIKDKGPLVTVTAIRGRPNPTSPGEVKLAAELKNHRELSGLFLFNQKIRTAHALVYCVDLVWPLGKLVVEVDGYRYHSGLYEFARDRHRDYELLISGYRVLRLTHSEIERDLGRSIAKIRDSVQFLKDTNKYGS